jgi:hypothetical protein
MVRTSLEMGEGAAYSDHHTDLTLTTQGQENITPIVIKRNEINKANCILGIHLSPDGDFSTQLKILKKKADTYAHSLRSPRLTPQDIHTFHRTTYGPSMRYVLPALAIDEEELNSVQAKVLASMLNKLGHSSTLPTEIRHGPVEMGGLALLDLRTEIGISQLKYLRDSVFSDNESGKLIIMSLKYSQIEAGIAEPLLEHPSIHLPYITPKWLTSVRQYLYQHTLTLTITDSLTVQLRGPHDKCIMSSPSLKHYTTTQQKDVNLVRLHLQIITLSDMVSQEDGVNACVYHINGKRRPHQTIRQKIWPRQEVVTPPQIKLWKRYISAAFLRYSNKWRQPPRHIPCSSAPATPIQHLSPQTYLTSLPSKWYRRLLFSYNQQSTDLDIWRAFRSRRRLIIASDGSLLPMGGTFGWTITTDKHQILY